MHQIKLALRRYWEMNLKIFFEDPSEDLSTMTAEHGNKANFDLHVYKAKLKNLEVRLASQLGPARKN